MPPHAAIEIIRAVPAHAAALTAIAIAAKQHWGYPAHWMAEWQPLLALTPAWIEQHPVYVAVLDQEPQGWYGVIDEPPEFLLEHLWVTPAAMGRGVGGRLFQHAVTLGQTLGAKVMTIEADPHALGFYVHMGAVLVGERLTSIEQQPRRLPLLQLSLEATDRRADATEPTFGTTANE